MVVPAAGARQGSGSSRKMSRQDAVKLEVASFLRAEQRRQDGMAMLRTSLGSIDGLILGFGTVSHGQTGRTIDSELEQLKRKLTQVCSLFLPCHPPPSSCPCPPPLAAIRRDCIAASALTERACLHALQVSSAFQHADGGFVDTFLLAKASRVADMKRDRIDADGDAEETNALDQEDADTLKVKILNEAEEIARRLFAVLPQQFQSCHLTGCISDFVLAFELFRSLVSPDTTIKWFPRIRP